MIPVNISAPKAYAYIHSVSHSGNATILCAQSGNTFKLCTQSGNKIRLKVSERKADFKPL